MTSLSTPPLGNNNNHQKMTEAVKALLEFKIRTAKKRWTNTNSNTVGAESCQWQCVKTTRHHWKNSL
jgi:hypothetical protein